MSYKKNNKSEAACQLDNLNKYSKDLPNIGSIINSFLTYSMNGEDIDNRRTKKELNKLSTETIKRIKKILNVNDNDLLISLIKECKDKAINEDIISTDELEYTKDLSFLYLKIIEKPFDAVSKCSGTLEVLCKYRKRLLAAGKLTDENIIKMFDFIEMTFITEKVRVRMKRYDRDYTDDYYISDDSDEIKVKMMQDLKPYIYQEQYRKAVQTCCFKFSPATVPIYIQAFLMLEYNSSFTFVAHFLTNNINDMNKEEIEGIIKELATYSKKGTQFYEFYRRAEGKALTEEDSDFIKTSNEEMKRCEAINKARQGSKIKQILPSWLRK